MLGGDCRKFLNDELGGGTVMGLLWFILLVGITGMAVDATNGFRNRTMLQATADAAALGGAIDLTNEAAVVASAVAYSAGNMPGALYGDVLQPGDVEIGAWDMATRSFTEGGLVVNVLDPDGPLVPDAVRVTLHQTDANANAVPVNFLRIIGLQTWDVNVEAVAQRFIPECLKDGLIARGIVDISSNNGFVNQICIHGQQGVDMQSNNYFEGGVNVTMPSMSMLELPASGMESNIGLPEALRENYLDPRMVNHVNEIMTNMLTMQNYVTPDYIDTSDTSLLVEVKDKNWDFSDATAGHVYHIQCNPMKQVGIPSGIALTGVVIVSDCQVLVGADVSMSDVVLASLSDGNPGVGSGNGGGMSGAGGAGVEFANIVFAAGVNLGTADNCQPGGGVQIFSNASIHFSSTTTYNGVQIVAAGDVELGARDIGVNGISVQAGGDITLTSNNMFGLCSGGAPNLFTVPYYRLVR